MKHYLSKATCLAAILSIASCGSKDTAVIKEQDAVIPVKTMSLSDSNENRLAPLSGYITTDDEVYLGFKTGGVIRSVYVKEGDFVHKGQTLATLDLTEINAGVAQAQSGVQKAERDYARTMNLYKDSVATLEQLQNAKTALDIARQQLKNINFNRRYSEIKSPGDGYVLKKLANEGQVIGPGTPVLQTNGAKSGQWLLKAGAADVVWRAIRKGDAATVYTGIDNTNGYEGEVIRKSESTDPYTGLFTIEIAIKNTKDTELASGMFGKAVVKTQTKAGKPARYWSVPYDALLDADGRNGFLFVTHDGKKAEKIKVQIGSMGNDAVIIESGLSGDEQVIISGSAYLTDNSLIKITR